MSHKTTKLRRRRNVNLGFVEELKILVSRVEESDDRRDHGKTVARLRQMTNGSSGSLHLVPWDLMTKAQSLLSKEEETKKPSTNAVFSKGIERGLMAILGSQESNARRELLCSDDRFQQLSVTDLSRR